ncbi:tetratricopeptide repeat protein [Mariniphaga sediminis]|uniref:tetratricopeptide repeat protein n=1 Tax=Mariniphaga sediminis TaxID=1628158 RepID=UPI003561BABB
MQKETFYRIIKNHTLLNEETLPELRQLTTAHPYFQAAWILYLKNLKKAGSPEFDATLKKVAPMVPDRKQLYRVLFSETKKAASGKNYLGQKEIQPPDYILGNTDDQSSGNNLIDKFLSAKPGSLKIEKPHHEGHLEKKENEMIEKSVAENDELITETLAMIYLEQKKYDKALEAFKKLSLKYPEKSIYFASRIEETKKLKNI